MEAQNWQGSQSRSGIFTLSLDPSGNNTFDVYCDEEWTVVQRRKDGSEIFDRGFEDYTNGFGDLAGEFWLGLRKLHLLTQTPSVLLIELQLLNGNRVFAMYKLFQVRLTGLQNENRYQLIVGNYVGTAGDALGDLNEVFFSTRDSDNDDDVVRNCAGTLGSGWWFKKCISQYTVSVDLNGNYPSGIRWRVGSTSHAITSVTMKIKPKQGNDILKFFFHLLFITHRVFTRLRDTVNIVCSLDIMWLHDAVVMSAHNWPAHHWVLSSSVVRASH